MSNINFDEIIKNAAKKTDQELASNISSLTRFTDDEINEIAPEPGDKAKVAELIKIIKSSDDQNVKVNNIIQNSEEFIGIAVKILGKVL